MQQQVLARRQCLSSSPRRKQTASRHDKLMFATWSWLSGNSLLYPVIHREYNSANRYPHPGSKLGFSCFRTACLAARSTVWVPASGAVGLLIGFWKDLTEYLIWFPRCETLSLGWCKMWHAHQVLA